MDSRLHNYAKLPIPVINNISPHNYVIMPALLAHIDRPVSPSILQTQFLTTKQRTGKQLSDSLSKNNKLMNVDYEERIGHSDSHPSNIQLNNINGNSQDKDSLMQNNNIMGIQTNQTKESLYRPKHIELQSQYLNNSLINSVNLQTNSVNSSNLYASNNNYITSSTYSCYRLPQQQQSTILDGIDQLMSDDSMLKDSNRIQEKESENDKYVNSITESISQANFNDIQINNFEHIHDCTDCTNCNIATGCTDCQIEPTDKGYKSLFDQSFPRDQQNINQVNHFKNKPHQSQPEILQPSNTNDNLSKDQSSVITYTISCPPEWQLNLNRMVNCYVSFQNINRLKGIKLKCSVCQSRFSSVADLVKHKENLESCRNNINISQSFNNEGLLNRKKKRKKELTNRNSSEDSKNLSFNLVDNYYEDEDELELSSIEEINSEDEEIEQSVNFNDKEQVDEYIDDETLHMSLFTDTALKGNTRLKKKLLSKPGFKRNKLLTELTYNQNEVIGQSETIMSLNEEFLRSSKSSNNQNEKTVKPRRKYNKNKTDHVTHLTCENCNKTCRTKAELLVHLHKHAGNEPECWVCGKTCASFSNLVSHVQLHTGEKPYTCQFCGKQFTQDAHLTRHIRLHTGERPFVCNICGKNYKDYSYYKTHLRIHRGERLYKCKYCNKEYYDASYYKKHTRLHTGEKPYMCTVCGRQFHRSDYLKLHMYSHTDERPFNCHICGKGFKMNYNLKVHLKNHEHDLTNATIISSNEDTTTFNISETSINSNNIDMTMHNSNENSGIIFMDSLQQNQIISQNKPRQTFISTENLVNSHVHQIPDNSALNLNLNDVNNGFVNNIDTNEMVSYIMDTNVELNRPINLIGTRSYEEQIDKINMIQASERNQFNVHR